MIHISKRLLAVAAMVSPGSRLADVGTDHGYVPIWLMQNNIISEALAMDINAGPLDRARDNIAQCGLSEHIRTRRSDGLEALIPGEADSLVIAGMGGLLMKDILSSARQTGKLACFKEMILQPQSDVDALRRALHGWGYCIDREDMVVDAGKFYVMMHVVAGDEHYDHDWEYIYGRCLLLSGHPVLKAFLTWQQESKQALLKKLETVETAGAADYRPRLSAELSQIRMLLDTYF